MYCLLFLHEVRVCRYQEFWIDCGTKSSFRKIYSFSMYFSQLNTIFIFSKMLTLICLDEMTVINLTQFLIIEILDKEVNHFSILLINIFRSLIFLQPCLLFLRSVNQINRINLFGYQFSIPANEEVITI